MDERIIISGNLGNVKKIRNIIFFIGLFLSIILWIYTFATYMDYSDLAARTGWKYWMTNTLRAYFIVGWVVLLGFVIIGNVVYAYFSKIEITVTDKRVYGCAGFGKRVDLPLDSISAIGTSALKGIAVSTSSGAIKFYMLQNRDEVHSVISKLISERQNTQTTIKQEVSKSDADELKKFKELLDSGIISQEEFEAKKKQLLGL